jgi:predicted HD phosphohydrolase
VSLHPNDLARWLKQGGAERYGDEPATLLSHLLQSAQRAADAGLPDSLIVACGLHDIGHAWLVCHQGAVLERNDLHEDLGADLLAPLLPPSVVGPVRLHVAAKRYLCAIEPRYHDGLSAGSRHSLAMQGGPMAAAESRDFAALPWAADAVTLRRIDDLAKGVEAPEMPLAELKRRIEAIATLR